MREGKKLTETIREKIRNEYTKIFIVGGALQLTGYILYKHYDTLFTNAIACLCFIMVLPFIYFCLKIDSASKVIDKREKHLQDRHNERRIKKSLLKQMKKISDKNYKYFRVLYFYSALSLCVLAIYNCMAVLIIIFA